MKSDASIDQPDLAYALSIAAEMDSGHGEDIAGFAVTTLCSYTDFLFICTARNAALSKAMAGRLIDLAKSLDRPVLGYEGEISRDWVLVDLGDVIIHIFLPEARSYYDLESLWLDAERLDLKLNQSPDAHTD